MRLCNDLKHRKQYDTLLKDAYTEREMYLEANGNKPQCLLEEGGECHWRQMHRSPSVLFVQWEGSYQEWKTRPSVSSHVTVTLGGHLTHHDE